MGRMSIKTRSHSGSGGLERDNELASNFAAGNEKPPVAGAHPARPKFAIKSIMILISLWALPNALVVYVMRSGEVTGTPEQLSQWIIQTFVAVNLVVAFVVAWLFLFLWLIRLVQFNNTGGTGPIKRKIDHAATLIEPQSGTLSPQDRLIKAVALAFGLGWALLVVIGRDEPVLWEFNDWFPVPRVIFVPLVGALLIMAALASSVRRR
jgi:hypothetical protein